MRPCCRRNGNRSRCATCTSVARAWTFASSAIPPAWCGPPVRYTEHRMTPIAPAAVARSLALVLFSAAAVTLPGVAAAEARPLPEAPAQRFPPTPAELFDGLFVAVQSARVYPDGKTFADALPSAEPAQILEQYRRQPPQTLQVLRSFVEAHFRLPAAADTTAAAD